MEILRLIDGAHGISYIDLAHLGSVGPEFFTSNLLQANGVNHVRTCSSILVKGTSSGWPNQTALPTSTSRLRCASCTCSQPALDTELSIYTLGLPFSSHGES